MFFSSILCPLCHSQIRRSKFRKEFSMHWPALIVYCLSHQLFICALVMASPHAWVLFFYRVTALAEWRHDQCVENIRARLLPLRVYRRALLSDVHCLCQTNLVAVISSSQGFYLVSSIAFSRKFTRRNSGNGDLAANVGTMCSSTRRYQIFMRVASDFCIYYA